MPVYNDPAASSGTGWRWKPVDIIVIVIAFAVWWPLGLAALAWKLWNDRQPNPTDLGQALQTGAARAQTMAENLWASLTASPVAGAAPAPTGNAAFDAHIREEWDRIAADRRRLDEEIAAFRAFLAQERSGDRDVYERFRDTRGPAGRA